MAELRLYLGLDIQLYWSLTSTMAAPGSVEFTLTRIPGIQFTYMCWLCAHTCMHSDTLTHLLLYMLSVSFYQIISSGKQTHGQNIFQHMPEANTHHVGSEDTVFIFKLLRRIDLKQHNVQIHPALNDKYN